MQKQWGADGKPAMQPGGVITWLRHRSAAITLFCPSQASGRFILKMTYGSAMRFRIRATHLLYLTYLIGSSSVIPQSVLPQSVLAQTISEAQMRAANMARMQAEELNGGLRVYSADDCMHKGGGGTCLVSETEYGYRFRFLGGPPGWTSRREPATVETQVLVSPDAKEMEIEYNGPPRPAVNP